MLKKASILLGLIITFFIFQVICAGNVLAAENYYVESSTNDGVKNYSYNNYSTYGNIVGAYLEKNSDNTISKIQFVFNSKDSSKSKVLIEKYDSNFKYISSKEIKYELSTCGGYFGGEKFNFLVFGQFNKDDDDSLEVIRIVKYDKNWNRISSCSVKAINTYNPFASGSCRMEEKDGVLYIDTCHTMYKSADGLHHQSNMLIKINEETMQTFFSRNNVSYIGYGYVSHSFNQYITLDDSYIYTIDHGDSYPRGITVCKTEIGKNIPTETAIVFPISGTAGNNSTGVSIGGAEVSNTSCIIAGNSVKQNSNSSENSDYSEQRNIFISVVDKNSVKASNVVTKWLTSYAADGNTYCNTPHLVKINDNQFVVLWEEVTNDGVNIRAVMIDGQGNNLSNVITIGGRLSDCKPIVYNNKLMWTVSTGEKVVFFSLDISSVTKFNSYNNQGILNLNKFEHFTYSFNKEKGIYELKKFDNKVSNITLPKCEYPWLNFELGSQAFYTSNNIKSVIFPEGYTIIPNGCFNQAVNLEKVTLPTTLKEIRTQAFCSTKLQSLDIPDNVTTIGTYAFAYMTDLSYLKLPKNLTVIPERLCSGDSSLDKITFPSKVETIGKNAFSSNGLTSISIPSSVKKIDNYAFAYCDRINGKLVIPSNVTNIGNSVFEQCNNIERLELQNINAITGTSILTNEKSMYVGEEYKPTVGVKFSNVKASNSNVTISTNGTITANNEGNTTVTYCDENGNTVISTYLRIYKQKAPITKIELSKNVIYLKNKETVNLSISVVPNPTTENKSVIWSSSNLNVARVNTSGKVTAVGNGTATITATSIANSQLKSTCKVVVADSFENKYEYKILDNNNIKITKYIGSSSNVSIPSKIDGYTVTELGGYIFGDYSNPNTTLKTVTIPNTVIRIESAFSYCKSIEKLTIPKSVTVITQSFTYNCDKLKEIAVDSDNPSFISQDGVLYEKYNNEPRMLKLYPAGKQDNKFVVPSTVTTIDGWSLNGNNYIQEIQCLSNVSYININAIKNLSKLNKLYILNANASMGNRYYSELPIENCPNLTIYGIKDSTAQTYANNNNIKFEAFECKITSLKVEKTSYNFNSTSNYEYIKTAIEPQLATNKKLTYTSANTNVVRVSSSGQITPVGNGTTQITVNTTDGSGKKAVVNVNVDIKCNKITIYSKTTEINGNNKGYVNAYAYPRNAKNTTLKYTIKNTQVATINQSGVISPVKNGNTELYIETTDGSNLKETLTITVKGQKENAIVESSTLPFTDVKKSDWYYNDLKYCYDRGIITGTDKNTFDSNAKFTKGMLVMILWRMEGKPKAKYTTNFVDCPKWYWCYDAAQWSISSGVAYKLDDTHFNPEKVLERHQFIECLRNYARIKGKDTSARADLTKFLDYKQEPEYSRAAMSWAVAKKIMLGGDNGTKLYPLNTATKAEAVSFIARYCREIGL